MQLSTPHSLDLNTSGASFLGGGGGGGINPCVIRYVPIFSPEICSFAIIFTKEYIFVQEHCNFSVLIFRYGSWGTWDPNSYLPDKLCWQEQKLPDYILQDFNRNSTWITEFRPNYGTPWQPPPPPHLKRVWSGGTTEQLAPGRFPPGQLPTRRARHQENSPLRQLPTRDIHTRTIPLQDNYPLRQFPTRTIPHPDNSRPH